MAQRKKPDKVPKKKGAKGSKASGQAVLKTLKKLSQAKAVDRLEKIILDAKNPMPLRRQAAKALSEVPGEQARSALKRLFYKVGEQVGLNTSVFTGWEKSREPGPSLVKYIYDCWDKQAGLSFRVSQEKLKKLKE